MPSALPILILKTGSTHAHIRERLGDFENSLKSYHQDGNELLFQKLDEALALVQQGQAGAQLVAEGVLQQQLQQEHGIQPAQGRPKAAERPLGGKRTA